MSRIVVLLLATGALATSPSVAEARSRVIPDARGDVLEVGTAAVVVPRRVDGDIVRTVFRHKDKRIRVRVSLAELRRNFESFSVFLAVRTNEGLNRFVVVTVDRFEGDPWSGSAGLYRPFDEGTWVPCSIHHSIDYQANEVVIGFSRRCIGSPSWVKLGAMAQIWLTTGVEYQDDARLKAEVDPRGLGTLTRRIYRGSS